MPLASVSKPVAALAVLVAAEEGVVDLDEPAGPPGSTVRHLLAHASGLPFEGTTPIAPPGRRRIYSNEAFRVLGDHLAARAEMPFADYVRAAVARRSGSVSTLMAIPGSGMHASLDDVLAIGRELLAPTLVAPETLRRDDERPVSGALRRAPGPRPLRSARLGPRRAAQHAAAVVDGHAGIASDVRSLRGLGDVPLGRSRGGVVCAALTTREFGDWAKEAWPRLSDAVRPSCGEAASPAPSSAKSGRMSSSNVAASQLATRQGVIAVTVAVRGMPIASATSPKYSPARRTPPLAERRLRHAAMPESST